MIKGKLSNRDLWVASALPAVFITGIYLFGFYDRMGADLEKEQKRMVELSKPLPPPPPTSGLATAKKALEDAKKAVPELEAKVAELEVRVQTPIPIKIKGVVTNTDDNLAQVIQRVEATFSHHGVTPIVSESAEDSKGGKQPPGALVSVLSGKTEPDAAHAATLPLAPRVWHFVFDDKAPHFEEALKELETAVPTATPLSMNLVYNPENNGDTRLLELWLLY